MRGSLLYPVNEGMHDAEVLSHVLGLLCIAIRGVNTNGRISIPSSAFGNTPLMVGRRLCSFTLRNRVTQCNDSLQQSACTVDIVLECASELSARGTIRVSSRRFGVAGFLLN